MRVYDVELIEVTVFRVTAADESEARDIVVEGQENPWIIHESVDFGDIEVVGE